MNVLSLFDGMSCGQLALREAGINYDNYYASEINKYAIKVTQENFPNTIQLGNVLNIDSSYFNNIQIDLIIAGSPCQGFSRAGKELNFEDERSKLFFEFIRLFKELKPKYFLLENVIMKKEYQDIISSYLNVEPIRINSSLLTAQLRDRLYWTNIPNVTQPNDLDICINEILENPFEKNYQKIKTTDQINSCKKSNNGQQPYMQDRVFHVRGKTHCLTAVLAYRLRVGLNDPKTWRKITAEEAEKLQAVPVGYTKCVSNFQRFKMLGNGWTVSIVAHILKNIII